MQREPTRKEDESSLAAQQVKDPTLSLLWHMLIPGLAQGVKDLALP